MNDYKHKFNKVNILMPEHYFQHDEKWIRDMLLKLKPSVRNRVAIKYSKIYQEYFEKECIHHKKENSARKAANERLRLFIKNQASFLEGYVSEPQEFKEG